MKLLQLPFFLSRSKTVADQDRVFCPLFTVQHATPGADHYRNIDYLTPLGCWESSDSSALFSFILNAINVRRTIGSSWIVQLDNYAGNKSQFFVGAFGFVLERLENVKDITLLYPTVGHTHNSVDQHFGAYISRRNQNDILTPAGFHLFVSSVRNILCIDLHGVLSEMRNTHVFYSHPPFEMKDLVTKHVNPIAGISAAHCVRISKNDAGGEALSPSVHLVASRCRGLL